MFYPDYSFGVQFLKLQGLRSYRLGEEEPVLTLSSRNFPFACTEPTVEELLNMHQRYQEWLLFSLILTKNNFRT